MSKQPFLLRILILSLSLLGAVRGEAIERKLSVLASVRPLALVAEEIVGEEGEVGTIIDSTIDPHIFELRPSDVIRIETADLLFINGNNFEFWLPEATQDKRVPLAERSGAASTEWTSPKSVSSGITRLVTRLCSLKPQSCSLFQGRADKLLTGINRLDTGFQSLGPKHHSFLAAHSVWGKFAQDYHLQELGGIVECEEKVSPAEFIKISRAVKESGLTHIIVEPWMKESNYESLLTDLNLTPVKIDSMGSKASSYSTYLEETFKGFRQVLQ